MSQLFDNEFLKKIERLAITSKIIMSDGAAGNRKSRSRGSSVEFSDYREYAEGDDYRRIDWNAYGRFEKLFIKLFMEEREARVHILLDTSRSMDWGEPNKSFASRRLAAALAYISLSNYDSVSLVALSNRTEKVKLPIRGKNSFTQVLDFLENIQYNSSTDLVSALKDMNMKSERGISILISDLFSEGNLLDVIKYLQIRKQEVYICHVLSPQEINPEIDDSLRLIDMETGEAIEVTYSQLLMKTYRKVYNDFISGIERLCFKRGVEYMLMDSSMPLELMVREVVERKRRAV